MTARLGERWRNEPHGYDSAQICPNGHVTNEHLRDTPHHSKEFCENCGEKTLTRCPKCSDEFLGALFGMHGFFKPAAHCHNCGAQFPWTERRIQAAIELAAEELSAADSAEFQKNVNVVARDTPNAQVAANRISKLLGKVRTGAADALRKLVIDVASKTAAEIILKQMNAPPPNSHSD